MCRASPPRRRDRVKIDGLTLNAEGCRLVAAEVLRILEDAGCFDLSEAA